MVKKKVTPRCGRCFEVDTEACEKFGFNYRDRIVDNNNNNKKGTVMGVAGRYCGEGGETLWYSLDQDGGKVSFSEPWEEGDLTLSK